MKIFLSGCCIVMLTGFLGCNGNSTSETGVAKINKDSSSHAALPTDTDIAVIHSSFHDVDQHVSIAMATITRYYLEIKNALAADKSGKAADGGREMVKAINALDKSYLTSQQRKLYDANERDLKENAEHISESGGNIGHQREHFSFMSDDMYSLVKAFGGGQPLYHDFCPMYDNNNGALWLSETAEIKNPYYGSRMPECGEAKEKVISDQSKISEE